MTKISESTIQISAAQDRRSPRLTDVAIKDTNGDDRSDRPEYVPEQEVRIFKYTAMRLVAVDLVTRKTY
jgi:hypothetical protein